MKSAALAYMRRSHISDVRSNWYMAVNICFVVYLDALTSKTLAYSEESI